MLKKGTGGITLIALVVTIIVLLILAGISLMTISGRNSVIKRAADAKVQTIHETIHEALQMEDLNYLKNNKLSSKETFIEYLNSKGIIGEEIGSTGKYQIDVEKLLGEKQSIGNGKATETSEKDVYLLENNDSLELKYYGNNVEDNAKLGEFDNNEGGKEPEEEIKIATFKGGNTTIEIHFKEGDKWLDYANDENSEDIEVPYLNLTLKQWILKKYNEEGENGALSDNAFPYGSPVSIYITPSCNCSSLIQSQNYNIEAAF